MTCSTATLCQILAVSHVLRQKDPHGLTLDASTNIFARSHRWRAWNAPKMEHVTHNDCRYKRVTLSRQCICYIVKKHPSFHLHFKEILAFVVWIRTTATVQVSMSQGKIICDTHSCNFTAMILYHEPSLCAKALTYQPQSQSWGSDCWSEGWGWRRRWRSCSPSRSCFPLSQWRCAIQQLPDMINIQRSSTDSLV